MKVSNPLDVPQSFTVDDTLHTVPPHGTIEIDPKYRPAIWHIRCGRPECNDSPWCRRGHKGLIIGGLAPKLIEGE